MTATATGRLRRAAPRAGRSDGRPQAPLSLLALVAFLATLWWAAPRLNDASVSANAWMALLSAVLTGAAIAGMGRGRWLGVAGVYFIVFAVFHLGIAPMLAMGWEVPDFGDQFLTLWVDQLPVHAALYAVAVALASYGIGVRFGNRFGARSRLGPPVPEVDAAAEERVASVALVASAIGVLGWLGYSVSVGGVGILFSSYLEYREATEDGPLPNLYLLIGLGAALWAVSPRHPYARLALWFIAGFGALALVIGLRGEIMFPAAAAVAVLVKGGRLVPNPRRWILVFLVVLSGIALVRSVRLTGVSDIAGGVDVNPLHGAAELGYSLRPVAQVIEWQATIDDQARGRTYVRPVERLLAKPLPIIDVPPASEDPYIMNTVVAERSGQIGFSPVAEGIVNFGTAGVAGYMFLVGVVLGFLDRRPATVSSLVLSAVVLVPLLIQTRNSFVPVVLNLLIGAAVWVEVLPPRRFGRDRRRALVPARGGRHRAGASTTG